MALIGNTVQDIDPFIQLIEHDAQTRLFLSQGAGEGSVIVARAPGRLDVMGGVADYSGALVAEATIAEAAIVALRKCGERTINIWSAGVDTVGMEPRVSVPLDVFFADGALVDFSTIRERLTSSQSSRWAAYIAGCFYILLLEGIADGFRQGANIVLSSAVPLGAGVSSSAAIEVATMQAVCTAYGLTLEGDELARLAQSVENNVVGAPCGIMDQMASALGVTDGLMLLLCQPNTVKGTQSIPNGVTFFGINSAVKHSVGGGAYTRARIAAFMGRKILASHGMPIEYLVELTLEQLAAAERDRILPTAIVGCDFLEAHGETGDQVTRIDPNASYPVLAATRHAVYEHRRVESFLSYLADRELIDAGAQMYASNESYTSIGLGCAETDMLVNMARERGPKQGIYGAKITGGGSGGTVAVMTETGVGERVVKEIATQYQEATGLTPQIFVGGLSPGALEFGSREVAFK